jgi:mono/diheme cytochrome c family protein
VTEIPEHLLKRAAQRRAALGGGDAPADAPAGDAPAAAAPAGEAKAAVPAKKAPAPLPTLDDQPPAATPDIPVVAAAKARKRAPYWATALLASLPLWAFLYVFSIAQPPAGENDPFTIGAEVYSPCAGCHGSDGGGGTGPQLSGGEIVDTFADPLTMIHWIRFGADEGARADGTYGDLARPGGPHNVTTYSSIMAGWELSPEEMAAVVIYIREELSGADPAEDPNFNAELFAEDAAGLEAMVEAVYELGATGDPDVSGIEGAETDEG